MGRSYAAASSNLSGHVSDAVDKLFSLLSRWNVGMYLEALPHVCFPKLKARKLAQAHLCAPTFALRLPGLHYHCV